MLTRRSLLAAAAVAPVLQSRPSYAKRPPYFTMDVHVHFGADGPGATHTTLPRDQQVAQMYGPWDQIYDVNGNKRPRPQDAFDTLGSAEKLVAFLDDNGIDVAAIFPFSPNRVASSPREVRGDSTNEAIADAIRQYPDRLVGLCGHDPFISLWEGPIELKRRVEKFGFKGMKLYPPYYKFDPSNRDLDPLYKTASDVGAVLTFHTGWTPLVRAPAEFGRPMSLDDVALRFPSLKINMAHAGGVSWWEEAVLVAARHRNMTLDISSWCGYPPQHMVKMLSLARDLVGLDRVLFGSEHTLCPPAELMGLVLNLGKYADRFGIKRFADTDLQRILGANAARVYGIEPKIRT